MGYSCRVGAVNQAGSNGVGGGGQSDRERMREQAKQKKKKEEEERSICLRPSSFVSALQSGCDQYQGDANIALLCVSSASFSSSLIESGKVIGSRLYSG